MKIDELLKRLDDVKIKEKRVMKSLKQMFRYAKKKGGETTFCIRVVESYLEYNPDNPQYETIRVTLYAKDNVIYKAVIEEEGLPLNIIYMDYAGIVHKKIDGYGSTEQVVKGYSSVEDYLKLLLLEPDEFFNEKIETC
jgi:16S rRNA C967 or C1407 C5-methylase (RsmB/RsmF family)